MKRKPLHYKRSVIDFPVAPNTLCWLSEVKFGEGSTKSKGKYIYLDLVHCTNVQRLEIGKEHVKKKVYFRDRYFLSVDSDHPENTSNRRNLIILLSTLGCPKPPPNLPNEEFLKAVGGILGGVKNKINYYFKTRMELNETRNTLYIARGFHPYISLKPTLRYSGIEDEYHTFYLFGEKRLQEIEEELANVEGK